MDREKLGQRLKYARDDVRHMSLQDVADASGVARSTVQRYEAGKIQKIKLPVIESFARVLNVNPDWLACKSDDMEVPQKQQLPSDAILYEPGPTVLIPLVGVVNCGIPLFADDNIEDYILTDKKDVLTGETYFWLKAKGDSMINVGIHDGDLLFIRQQSDVDSGDIAVVSVNGDDATLKRVIKKENSLVLQPENPAHETKIYVGSEIDNICIRGRLMKAEKRF